MGRRLGILSLIVLATIPAGGRADAGTTSSGPFVYVKEKATIAPPTGGAEVAERDLVVSCPDGTRTVGAGGSYTGFNSLTRIEPYDVSPVFDPDGDEDDAALVSAANLTTKNQKVTGVAVCMKETHGAGDLDYGEASFTASSGTGGGGSLGCSAGQEAIGGGAGFDFNGVDALVQSLPLTTGWAGYLEGAGSGDRDLDVYSICLPSTLRDIVVVEKLDVPVVEDAVKKTVVKCAGGRRVVSGGWLGSSASRVISSVESMPGINLAPGA